MIIFIFLQTVKLHTTTQKDPKITKWTNVHLNKCPVQWTIVRLDYCPPGLLSAWTIVHLDYCPPGRLSSYLPYIAHKSIDQFQIYLRIGASLLVLKFKFLHPGHFATILRSLDAWVNSDPLAIR